MQVLKAFNRNPLGDVAPVNISGGVRPIVATGSAMYEEEDDDYAEDIGGRPRRLRRFR